MIGLQRINITQHLNPWSAASRVYIGHLGRDACVCPKSVQGPKVRQGTDQVISVCTLCTVHCALCTICFIPLLLDGSDNCKTKCLYIFSHIWKIKKQNYNLCGIRCLGKSFLLTCLDMPLQWFYQIITFFIVSVLIYIYHDSLSIKDNASSSVYYLYLLCSEFHFWLIMIFNQIII